MKTGALLMAVLTTASFLGVGALYSQKPGKEPQRHPPKSDVQLGSVQKSTHSPRMFSILDKRILRPQTVDYKYNKPMDLIELIPLVRDINRIIPRQFSLADHQFKLDPDKMTIHHEFMDLETRTSPKNSIITFSYLNPVGGQMGTRLDIPLFYSSILGFSNWSRYPMGNYTMTINRTDTFGGEKTLYIRALTRF